MIREQCRVSLIRWRSEGYRFVWFESAKDSPINPKAWVVDMVFPGDDYVTIDAAIADTRVLRGRMVLPA